jgi:hypothetical protein
MVFYFTILTFSDSVSFFKPNEREGIFTVLRGGRQNCKSQYVYRWPPLSADIQPLLLDNAFPAANNVVVETERR